MFKLLIGVGLCILLTACPAMAEFYYWNLTSGGDWVDNSALWAKPDGITTGVVPGNGDLAIIKNPGTVYIDATHLFPGIPNDIWVGDGTTPAGWPNGPFGPGEGHVVQTGGTVNYGYWFIVGRWNAPGTSTYNLESGSIVQTYNGGNFIVGEVNSTGILTVSNDSSLSILSPGRIGIAGGNGTMNMSGTTTATFLHMDMGWDAGSIGTINLSDQASLTSQNWTTWGVYGGTANLNMSGDSQYNGNYGFLGGHSGGTVNVTMNDNAHIDFQAWLNFGEANSHANLVMNQNASIHADYLDLGWGDTANASIEVNNTSSINVNNGINIGINGPNAHGAITLNDDATLTTGWINLGSNGAGAQGMMTLNDNASVALTGSLAIGNVFGANGILTMSGNSSLTTPSWVSVSNSYDGGGSGEVFMSDNSSLSVTNNELEVAWGGTGTIHLGDGTVTDDAVVSSSLPVMLGYGTASADSYARINLNGGGTLVAPGIITGAASGVAGPQSSVLNFNGGTLKASADSADYMTNPGNAIVFQANVTSAGGTIDTNGFDIAINVGLTQDPTSLGGGLTKISDGMLTLGGASTYTGDTTVAGGALSVMGSVTSDVCVNSGAELLGNGLIDGDVMAAASSIVAPGGSIGTLTITGNATICGVLDVEYESDTDTVDLLNVAGVLNITGATLNFIDEGTLAADQIYVFAMYSSLIGVPAGEIGVPAGYTVDYAYNGNSIALVPEPATLALLSLGALSLLRKKRA